MTENGEVIFSALGQGVLGWPTLIGGKDWEAVAITEAGCTELIVPEVEDDREICFEQGRPCVYEPDNEPGIIMTE